MKNYWNNQPREISARFNCVCAETGNAINKGDTCIYYPFNKSVYHTESRQAKSFYSAQFDNDILGYNY
jgi:hypothetical protein